MKLKFTFIAILAMLSSFAVNAANLQQVDVVLPDGVSESTFGANTVTDGTNYYATLQAATEAVAGNAGAVLYCKPSTDVGSLQHAPVTATLTVYGNGANVTGFEHFDLGNTDPNGGRDITADMTLTIKNLDGFSLWGAKATAHTANVVIEDCADMGKVFISGTTGTLNITINDSEFKGRELEAVYSNADGAITLNNVAFSNLNKAINLNHKAAGTQTVTINGCSFTNCGNDVAADQIPVRVLTSVEGGKSVLNVSNTTFTGTPEGGADILLDYGVGVTEATVTGTAANLLPKNEDENAVMVNVTANQGYTNVAPTDVKVAPLAELQAALADNSNELPIIITETIVIPEGETVVLDLNGKTIAVPTAIDGKSIYALNNKGVLTIKDTKGNGSISARGIYNGYDGVSSNNTVEGAKLTIESGKFIALDSDGGAAILNCAELVIYDGTFKGVVAAVNNRAKGVATINGGTFAGGYDGGKSTSYIIQNNGGSLTINDANVVSGFGAVGCNSGKTIINGGSFLPTGWEGYTSHVVYVAGAAADVTINGGTFKMNYPADATPDSGSAVASYYNGKLSITGGSFYAHFDNVSPVELSNGSVITGGSYYNHSGVASTHPYVTNFIKEGYELGEDGKVTSSIAYVAKIGEQGYETLSAAFAAVTDDNQTVVLLADVTENLAGAYLRGNITTENDAKVTITLTNSGWVDCPYTFVLGENITLNVPYLFYYAGGSQINGTVVAGAYYQRYAGTKLTINEPGSMTVTSETCIIRYTDGDANAGIYINGDNNNETVGLNIVAAYLYQGMINAKNANIKAAVYWQTNETDNQGSANLVLDNSTLSVTGSELDAKATGNSTVTLTNGSSVVIAGGFVAGEKTELSIDATSYIQYRGGKIEGETVLAGKGTEADPYLISSVDDLVLFRNSVNAGETKYNAEGVYVALGANIDLTGIDWSVNIGDDCAMTFDGIFDGKGFTISNLTATETATKADEYICTGLFGAIYGNAVVKNFTLENVTINAPFVGNNVSAVVGFAYACKGSIENVKVVGVNINAPKATGVGAIVGYDYYSPALKVENCIVDGAEITAAAYAGGLVGYASSKIAMNNNTIEDVTVSATASVGAVAGIMLAGGSATDNTVKNVTLTATGALWANSSAVVAGTITGGAVTVSNTTVENVTANGAAARLVGGILVEKPATEIAKVQAQIGDKFYTTLQAAATAAKENETITLIADVEATEALNINCALDLNGHSLMATVAPTALPEGYAALPNLDGKFVIGAQPTATVNDLGATTVAAGEYSIWDGNFDSNTEDDGDMPLSFVMQFLADQDAEDMATSPFADWYADFVLTFSDIEGGKFSTEGCYLAGYYGDFGWIKVPVEGILTSIEEGVRYPVMLGVGLGQKYEYICSGVKDFRCALYLTPEILAANPNIKVKLELAVVDNDGNSYEALVNNENVYSVTEYTYDALDFDPNYIAELEIIDGVNYTNDSEKTVGKLTYVRTLPAAGIWYPVFLPFDVPVDALAANFDVARINDLHTNFSEEDGSIEKMWIEYIVRKSGTLPAGKPFLVRAKNSNVLEMSIELENVKLYPASKKSTITVASAITEVTFEGVYESLDAPLSTPSKRYMAVNADGVWDEFDGYSLNPFRVMMTLNILEEEYYIKSAASLSVGARVIGEENEDGTTVIYDVEVDRENDGAIYDLQGRRVLETEKGGIYIKGGKKFIAQ